MLKIAAGRSIWRLERVRFTERVPVSLQTSFIPVDLCPDLARHDLRSRHLIDVLRDEYGVHLDQRRRVRRAHRRRRLRGESALGSGANAAVPDRTHHLLDERERRRVPPRAVARRHLSLPDRTAVNRVSARRCRASAMPNAVGAIAFGYEGERRMTAGDVAALDAALHRTGSILPARCANRRSPIAGRATGASRRRAIPPASTTSKWKRPTGTSVRWWNARLHAWHPFDHIVFVELPEGLRAGESVAMRYGEGRLGSPGYRVQTFIEEASPFSLRWQAAGRRALGRVRASRRRNRRREAGTPCRQRAIARRPPVRRPSCICESRTNGAIRRD